MKKGLLLVVLLIMMTLLGNATELTRNGWNLISVCQDMNRDQVNMDGIEEIQSQDGQTIYTGDFATYSNLNTLQAGYGYWVKGEVGTNFNSGESRNRLEKPLNRNGWNLMASCEEIPRADVNMTNFVEIQNQNGHTIYTGAFEAYSNLDSLESGYGYWVKGNQGTLFTSQRGLRIPIGFDYQTINNLGMVVETNYEGYLVKLYANYQEVANDQQNHTGIGITVNGNTLPIIQIQGTYKGHEIVVALYILWVNWWLFLETLRLIV
jgi:opacity protein-like surface antigen